MTTAVGDARGVLNAAPGRGRFEHARLAPGAALAPWIAHYWSVRWDLRGEPPLLRETLPHPNVHVVFEHHAARVHGIHDGRFRTILSGAGGVFGIKFRAGGFRPWWLASVASLRNTSLPLARLLGDDAVSLAAAIAGAEDDAACIAAVERVLGARRPAADPKAEDIASLVERAEREPAIASAAQLAVLAARPLRTLQRQFNEYVGVGPKWVVARYRLHEALARLPPGAAVDWAGFALALGYADQAHFIRDFRALVGCTPTAYVRRPV